MCHAQGHNGVPPVRLKHATHLSGVKYSTTEPLHSLPDGSFDSVSPSPQKGHGKVSRKRAL